METGNHDSLEDEKDEKVDHNKIFGKIVKEGTINVHDDFEEWVECHLIIREQGITLSHRTKRDSTQQNSVVTVVMDFTSPQEVGIMMLPDNARRSRDSKLFPFTVYKKITDEDIDKENLRIKRCVTTGVLEGENRDEVILATSNGREMWEWAACIQWLGTTPIKEEIPLFHEASTIHHHNKHYEDTDVLQNVLLKMFTYKNLPDNPTSFEDVARFNHAQKHRVLSCIYYPINFLRQLDEPGDDSNIYNEESDEDDDSSIYTEESNEDDNSNIYNEESDEDDDSNIYNEESDEEDDCNIHNEESNVDIKNHIHNEESDENVDIENHAHAFGLFAYIVLVGTCVQVNEKCFELITSSNLYDISSQVTWKGNSPLSMLCEGDYNSSRNYMVQALWRLGYPKLGGYYAGFCDESFTLFVSKPIHLSGVGNFCGGPVHPDDQKLCRKLRDEGDGRDNNAELSNQLIAASAKKKEEFTTEISGKITAILIPKKIKSWGCTILAKLNLSQNSIFELPDELYDFTSLTHLDLSRNCLFGLSHKLGNLTKLKYFHIDSNLIEELPYTIEKLEHIEDFQCFRNPITTPPSAIWSRGITDVRNFFRDMRESGTEVNMDLRVLVLGLSEAGKTSLINGMINPNARALTRVGDRTVGIEKRTWAIQRNKNQHPVNLLTYDFAGQEEYYITHHLFLGSKALYIIAFDLSKYEPGTLDKQILLWWESIQNRVCDVKSNDSKTPKVILVGTHADIVEDAQSLADDIHKSLTEHFISRMDDLKDRIENLENELKNLDPREKRILHDEGSDTNMKVTNEAATKQGEKEYKLLSSDEKAQILCRESEIKKLCHAQHCSIALPTVIQAVSSKDLRNFDALKEQISYSLTEIGPSGKYFPHLEVPVPRSWFQVRSFVRQRSTHEGYECMKLPKYFKLLSDELDINEDVGRRATKFCHDLGDVLFFEKEDLVFLQPSFLIDVFKYVIRHDHKESTYWTKKLLDQNISEEQFNKGKDLLLQKGELEQWLLEVLWSRLNCNLAGQSIMNNLIQLLETFDIGTSIEHKNGRILSIPEFQPKHLTTNWPRYKNNGNYETQRWISVEQKLPHGLLKRIQVRIFKKVFKRSGVEDINLAQNDIYILDKSLTELYCMSGKRTEECPGFGLSEGIRLYIRGKDKCNVMSLLSKVYSCVENTLCDYPGLLFDHYVVHTTQTGSSFMRLEEVQAIQAAGESRINFCDQIFYDSNKKEDRQGKCNNYQGYSCKSKSTEIILKISDLLPPSPKHYSFPTEGK